MSKIVDRKKYLEYRNKKWREVGRFRNQRDYFPPSILGMIDRNIPRGVEYRFGFKKDKGGFKVTCHADAHGPVEQGINVPQLYTCFIELEDLVSKLDKKELERLQIFLDQRLESL